MENIQTAALIPIVNKIYVIRDQKVMLDSDLAEIYGVETKRLNEQVKRNIERFSESFMFQLTSHEYDFLRSQNATLKGMRGKHRKFLPLVFTEHGVIMLASVLKSETAIHASIKVVEAFVEMRKFVSVNSQLFLRMDILEKKMFQTDEKLDLVYKALEDNGMKPKQGIFFDGQVFDAYTFVSDLIRSAESSLILIDNYIDDSVLTLLSKRKNEVTATIYTIKISKQLELDLKKHNMQYPPVKVLILNNAHDRFLIIDQKKLYHFGASLKDLGKKWFAFSKMETGAIEMLGRLNTKAENT